MAGLRRLAIVLLFAGVAAAAPALAQSSSPKTGSDATAAADRATIEELRKMLEEAKKLQAAQPGAKRGAAPAKAADGAKADPTAPAAEPEEPEPVQRPGCMYRGTTLIWEQKPGTCPER
jgi:hypothetical protein